MNREQRRAKTLEIIKAHPGLDATQLRDHGWTPQTHFSLRDLEQAGLIRWTAGEQGEGWYAVEEQS